ncbi:unnamed protein product [Cuscuta campestris]|uniref:Dirigent protein n=1 Tax=Cuscuta campestris TaxID=132261 RepID=A0A484KPT3_9ASTE|nr:unnamed protein product [Cuscuta campestris]
MMMNSSRQFFLISLFLMIFLFHGLHSISSASHHHQHKHRVLTKKAITPCKTLNFYLHDILYDGHNSHNATSAIVAAPAWANRTVLGAQDCFGDVIVFNDPITLDNNLHSKPVGWAQGFYLYDRKDVFTAWFAFTCSFNTTKHRGTINFAGADPLMNKTRDISVIGGTGDFFMARGVATFITDAFEGVSYFRVHIIVNLYECWI